MRGAAVLLLALLAGASASAPVMAQIGGTPPDARFPEGQGGQTGPGPADGTEAEEDAANGANRPHIRFKRVPFSSMGPKKPELITAIETEARPGVRLRQLDKMTGGTETVEVTAPGEVAVGRLKIRVDACAAPPDGRLAGTRAFLQIWDTKHPGADPVFSGWMFADSPALSALDHPRFDVWVIACTTSDGAVASGSQ